MADKPIRRKTQSLKLRDRQSETTSKSQEGSLRGWDRAVHAVVQGAPVDRERHQQMVSWHGWRIIMNPVWCYYGFILSVMALCVFGLIMVFSSSTVDLIAQGDNPWAQVLQQGIFAILGLIAAIILSRISPDMLRGSSPIVLGVGLFLQTLTITGLGSAAGGNVGWIVIGPLRFQPAEILKWSLCVWMPYALQLTRKNQHAGTIRQYAVPIVSFVAAFGAIMLGGDLGSAMITVLIGAVALFVGGFPLRWFVGLGVVGALGVVLVFVQGSSNRMNRILATYTECSGDDLQGLCYQAIHGNYALASGGLTGVGLGNSREKWNYLPAAFNDFIFAVIGEELGFLGALAVIVLFIIMGWCLINIAMRHQNAYARMVLMCIMVWLVGQGFINIAVVVGILPVMGLPLPFVSYGGTALVMCLAAAGTAIAMARSQDEIRAATSKR
ncbi:cell division protein FtsW [Galliscardovia ingluviei]|uniref:Probable peptidoglycan glycosyltransferase FtsW n=1 Tax=Galliscardovia ingluviei TaxID=1769422 RepID=A0A8J3EVH5_9BIFI|nr:putative peptidoglycan glycosyltransferase FtsW [Galliscardovia ingluviei]GGI13070.1 cell division protein FtsW [Galliscardovia ingluviei]